MSAKLREAVDISPGTKTVPTSYGTYATTWHDIKGSAHFELFMGITKGDATSMELMLDWEDEAGTTGYEAWKIVSGTASANELTFTMASLPSGLKISVPFDQPAAPKFRVRAKTTGGTGTATLTCSVMAGGGDGV